MANAGDYTDSWDGCMIPIENEPAAEIEWPENDETPSSKDLTLPQSPAQIDFGADQWRAAGEPRMSRAA